MLSNRKIGGVIIGLSIMTPFSYLSICNHDSCQDNIHYYSNPLNFSKCNFSAFLKKNVKKRPNWDLQSCKRNKVMNFGKPSTDIVALIDKFGQYGSY